MKEEVRIAIERLKSSCGITGKRWQDSMDSDISIQDAFETIERALNDTTLEIVKRKLDYYQNCVGDDFYFEPEREEDYQDALVDVLNEIITEAEGGK